MTVVSRCLGPVERWPSILTNIKDQGYNAVHFTPIQHYGQSFSHYSLADQTDISDYYFQNDVSGGAKTLINLTSPTQSSEESKGAAAISALSDADDEDGTPFIQPSGLSKEEKFSRVRQVIEKTKSKLGLYGIVDIVLNHTANNSAWIQQHPEACYNTDDLPRLYPAYLLDAELKKISLEFMKGNVSWCPSAPYVRNERDLDMVVREMTRRA